MFYNCTDMAMNAVRSFSQDGKMKYSGKGGNELLLTEMLYAF